MIAFIAALVFSGFYTIGQGNYQHDCTTWKTDKLRFFIGGSIICWLILPLGYTYIFFEGMRFLRRPLWVLLFYVLFIVGTSVYHLIGISWAFNSSCVPYLQLPV
jgi:hypothetical protein